MHNPMLRRKTLQVLQMRYRMHAHQLGECCPWRLMESKEMIQPLGNHVITNRRQTLRTFRVISAHVM